jgi:hypothetical protein
MQPCGCIFWPVQTPHPLSAAAFRHRSQPPFSAKMQRATFLCRRVLHRQKDGGQKDDEESDSRCPGSGLRCRSDCPNEGSRRSDFDWNRGAGGCSQPLRVRSSRGSLCSSGGAICGCPSARSISGAGLRLSACGLCVPTCGLPVVCLSSGGDWSAAVSATIRLPVCCAAQV